MGIPCVEDVQEMAKSPDVLTSRLVIRMLTSLPNKLLLSILRFLPHHDLFKFYVVCTQTEALALRNVTSFQELRKFIVYDLHKS